MPGSNDKNKKKPLTKKESLNTAATTKKAKKRTRNESSVSVAAETNEDVPKIEKNNIDQLIAQTFLRYKSEKNVDQALKYKEMSHLALMCEEYLSTFALIGYSLESEKIVMFNMPTPKDEAALVDLLRATFMDVVNNRP